MGRRFRTISYPSMGHETGWIAPHLWIARVVPGVQATSQVTRIGCDVQTEARIVPTVSIVNQADIFVFELIGKPCRNIDVSVLLKNLPVHRLL